MICQTKHAEVYRDSRHREHLQTGLSLTLCDRAYCNGSTRWVEMGLGWAVRVWCRELG